MLHRPQRASRWITSSRHGCDDRSQPRSRTLPWGSGPHRPPRGPGGRGRRRPSPPRLMVRGLQTERSNDVAVVLDRPLRRRARRVAADRGRRFDRRDQRCMGPLKIRLLKKSASGLRGGEGVSVPAGRRSSRHPAQQPGLVPPCHEAGRTGAREVCSRAVRRQARMRRGPVRQRAGAGRAPGRREGRRASREGLGVGLGGDRGRATGAGAQGVFDGAERLSARDEGAAGGGGGQWQEGGRAGELQSASRCCPSRHARRPRTAAGRPNRCRSRPARLLGLEFERP